MSDLKLQKNKQLIKKILVPVDYSECSDFVSRYAVKIACKLRAEIKFFHAYYAPSFDLIELSGTVEIQSHLKEEVAANLKTTEKEEAEKFIVGIRKYLDDCSFENIVITYEIAQGIPEDEIVKFSNEYEPDLVIMGTHGKDKANTIMGSVTESIIRKLKFPVMAIPEKYSFIGEKNVRNLMYVTEFDESDFITIKKLMDLTSQLNLKIFCYHIAAGEGKWDRIKMNGLKEYFKSAYGKTEVECGWLNQKNLLAALDKQVQDNNINIISLTSRQRGMLDKLFKADLTKKLFYHTNIPLLVFHS